MSRRPPSAEPSAGPPAPEDLPLEMEDLNLEVEDLDIQLQPVGGPGAALRAGLTLRHLYVAIEAALVLAGLGRHAEETCAALRARAGRLLKVEVIDLSLLWLALGEQRHFATVQAGRAMLYLTLYARGQWGVWLAAPADARIAIGLAMEEIWDVRRAMNEMEKLISQRDHRPIQPAALPTPPPPPRTAERWVRAGAVLVLCWVVLHWAGALLPGRASRPPSVASLTLPGLQGPAPSAVPPPPR